MSEANNVRALIDVLIKAEIALEPRHEIIVDLGPTPDILLRFGFTQRKMIVKASAIGKMFFDHCVPQSQIERLPAIIAKPKAIYQSRTRPGDAVVVMTYEFQAGLPVIVAVERDQPYGREVVNEVASMYGKSGPAGRDIESLWTSQGLRLWVGPKAP